MDPTTNCNTCGKSVEDRNSIKCNFCQTKVHLNCTYLNYVDSQYIKFSNKIWHCYNCSKNLSPFTAINKYMLYLFLSDKYYCNNDSNDSYLALKPPKDLSNLFSKFNNFSSDISNTPENVINSKYYDVNQLRTLKEFTDISSVSLVHVNIYSLSLSKNTDDLEHLIQSAKTDFHIIAILQSILIKDKLPPTDISLTNYSCEYYLMEANACGTLIYIRNHLSCKSRNDLNIYSLNQNLPLLRFAMRRNKILLLAASIDI